MKNFIIVRYLREVWSELRKVTWPTRNTAIKLTIIVLLVSAAVSFYAFALDLTFQFLIRQLVAK